MGSIKSRYFKKASLNYQINPEQLINPRHKLSIIHAYFIKYHESQIKRASNALLMTGNL
jgi:hypothetical protein